LTLTTVGSFEIPTPLIVKIAPYYEAKFELIEVIYGATMNEKLLHGVVVVS
jgi:hypothetical protein